MPHEPVEIRVEELLEERDTFGRKLAVAIVLTTLIGAVVAFLQAHALFEHDEAVARGQQWATLATAVQNRAAGATRVQIARSRVAHQDRLQAEQARARWLFGSGGNPEALRLEGRRWNEVARQTDRTSHEIATDTAREFRLIDKTTRRAYPDVGLQEGPPPKCDVRADGQSRVPSSLPRGMDPDQRPNQVRSYLTDSGREVDRLNALRDGATETAETAEKQFTRYAVSLAMFAVAVFLFGYALTPYGRRHRRLYALAASTLSIGAAIWGVYAFIRGPERPPASAATAYADGRVALDNGNYKVAIKDLSCAIDLHDSFALAYMARAEAYSARGSVQGPGFTIFNETLTDPHDRELALADEERAHELGADDPQLLTGLALDLYARGVSKEDGSDLESGVNSGLNATGANPLNPIGAVAGAIRLASAHFPTRAITAGEKEDLEHALQLDQEAEEALPLNPVPALKAGAILLALGRPWRQAYDHAERLVLKKANPLPMDYVAAALTDLDLLATKKLRPGLGSAVRAAKEDVVASTYSVAENSGASSTDIDRRATAQEPRRVSLLIHPALAEFGFTPPPGFNPARDRLFAAWYHKTPNGWTALPTLSGPAKLTALGGKYYSSRALSGCMPGGRYKLELYVNGRLAGSSTSNATVHFPELRQAPLGDLNADVCRPNDWRPVKDDIPGVASGYVNSHQDPRAGVMLFDMSASGAHGRAMASAALSRFSTMLPGESKPLGPPTRTYFMGETGRQRAYEYPHGVMIVGTGRTPIGRKLVAVVFEPTAHALGSSSTSLGIQDLFYSLTTRDRSITEPPVR